MPLEKDHCLLYTDECGVFQYQDKTNWGNPEEERNAAANVLIAAHVTEKAVEEFVPVDSQPYLSKLVYDINNTIDGHYRFEILRFPLYDPALSYVKEIRDSNDVIVTYANLVYYPTTNKFYKAIENNLSIPPDDPSGSIFWTEMIDSEFESQDVRKNTTIRAFVTNDIYTCRSRKCVKEALLALGCACDDPKKFLALNKKKTLLDGAQALSDDEKYSKAETNIRVLAKMCPKC